MSQTRLLSLLTFITNLGDYLSLFATLFLVYHLTNSALLAAYLVPIQSLAVAVSGIIFPLVTSRFSYRTIFLITQILSGIFILLIGLGWNLIGAYPVIGIYFCLSLLKQIFESARDSAGKPEQSEKDHRTVWVTIYAGRYGAQVIGPLLAFILIRYCPIQIPFLLDAASFFICAILSAKLVSNPTHIHSAFKPLVYLWKFPALWRLVLLRSIGFWIPAGIFNYLVFIIVKQIFQQDIMDSIWTYFSAGIGSVCATLVLRDSQLANLKWITAIRQKFKNLSDAHLSAIGLFGLAVTKMAFFTLSSFKSGLFIFGLSSFFMTFNAMGGQALRSKLTTRQQFPEIVGFEITLGKASDFLIATLCGFFIAWFPNTFSIWLWFSIIGYALLGIAMMSKWFDLERKSKN